ncbi:MAG: PadR family transcriptional regulator [Candidatus Syntrophoarchaeum sp. WYZ-LMO15]|nr:MAG: PadR family transcriptional regulator [Candidatus Syntrophoarchaeum sp. WYZ-LMO15]
MRMPSGFFKFHTLRLLNERPMYGYEIIREIERKTEKKPSQGSIYPILHELEEKGFVEATWHVVEKGPSRKYYHITDKGREEFERAKQKLTEAFNALFD